MVTTAKTPSRDNQDDRHCDSALKARSGCPRWNSEEHRPPITAANARPLKINRSIGCVMVTKPRPNQNNMPRPRPESEVNTIIDQAGRITFSLTQFSQCRIHPTPESSNIGCLVLGLCFRGLCVRGNEMLLLARWQVFVHRCCPLFRHQIETSTLPNHFAHLRLRITQITKCASPCWTGPHAGWNTVLFGEILVIDPIDTERAFLHDLLHRIHFASPVRAGPGTEATTNAVIFIHQHNPVFNALVGSTRRTHSDTRGIRAMQTRLRKVHHLRGLFSRHFEGVDPVQPRSGLFRSIGVNVRQWSPL